MPVSSLVGMGKVNVLMLFALIILLLSGSRVRQDDADYVNLLQSTDVIVQLANTGLNASSQATPENPAGTHQAEKNVPSAEIVARAAASERWWIRSKIMVPIMIIAVATSAFVLFNSAFNDTVGENVDDDILEPSAPAAKGVNVEPSRSELSPSVYKAIDLAAPICPMIVMPTFTAHFAVPLNALSELGAEGAFDVVDLSGIPLFCVAVQQVHGGRKLVLSMAIPGSTPRTSTTRSGTAPRVTIGPPQDSQGKNHELEICGPGDSLYGTLQWNRNGTHSVMRSGQTVMIVGGEPTSPRPRLKVTSGDLQLGLVKCTPQTVNGVDHLEVKVHPGVDAVLVLSCVLAVVLQF